MSSLYLPIVHNYVHYVHANVHGDDLKLAKNESAARPAFLAPSPAGWAPFAVGACPTGPGALSDHTVGVLNWY